MKAPILIAFSTILFPLTGCHNGTSDSEDIRTSGVYASISVTATEDDRSLVSVSLRVGNGHSNDYIALTNNDQLQATLNDSIMEDIDIKVGSSYEGSFNSTGAGQENASYRVSFIRPNDTNAPNSTVIMPQGLTGLSSSPSASFSRKTDLLTLTWNPTSVDLMVPIYISGDCFTDKTFNVNSSTGIYAINPLTFTSTNTPEKNCEATITANVTNRGSLDIAYGEGGMITATRITSTKIMSTP